MKVSKIEFKKNIIDIARDIFAQFGLKKTTMEDIARLLDKGKSTLYYYFKNKEEIFKAVIEKEENILKERIRQAVEREPSPPKKLKAYVLTKMKYLRNLINFYNALRDEYLKHYSFIQKIRKKYEEEEIRFVKTILKEGIDKGSFQIKDLGLTSFAIVTALKGLEYPLNTEESKIIKAEEGIDTFLNILFYGIMKR